MIPQFKTTAENFMLFPILMPAEDSAAETPFSAQTAEQKNSGQHFCRQMQKLRFSIP
jgi:hypothetical protein